MWWMRARRRPTAPHRRLGPLLLLLVLLLLGAGPDKELGQRLAGLQGNFRRREIEGLERVGQLREAAIGYMQLADSNPNDPKYDELLYNASVLFQRSKLQGPAIQARDRLLRERPTSPLAKRALFRNAQAYHFIGSYEQAAERYESFFEKYPEELAGGNEDPDTRIDAAAALHTAAVFRRGLGQTELYINDVRRFVQRYGDRKERFEEAAGLFFDLGQVFDQKKDYARLRQHLIEYLRQWGQKGGVDRQIIAEAKLGEIAWRESCPVAAVNGACIKVERARAAAAGSLRSQQQQRIPQGIDPGRLNQCGAETRSKITVFDRRPALVQEAMARFQRAQRLFRQGAAVAQVPGDAHDLRVSHLLYHVALARMAEGDKAYEALLRSKVPVGLVFDPRQPQLEAESRRQFQGWLKERSQRLLEIKTIYQEVLRFQSAPFVIAAAARIGQLYQDFASGLATAEVPQVPAPPGVDRGAFAAALRDSYCSALRAAAEPLEDEAERALATCLATSTALDWFSDWSKRCEVELNQMKPRRYPLAAELRAEPGYQRPGMDLATTLGAPQTP